MSTLDSLRRLVEHYRADGTSLEAFEKQFLTLHASMPPDTPPDLAGVVDELFWAVESYVSDPALRDAGDTGDEELRAAVRRSADALGTA